jgi:outer membrane protein OmpA-like peptidoglycan-associated protein
MSETASHEKSTIRRNRSRARVVLPWLAVSAAFLLAACSDTPDWANPVEWYHGATSVFDDDTPAPATNEAAQEIAKTPVPGQDQPFPTLGTVPERPKSVTPANERKQITDSLVADRTNAKYVDEPTPARPATLPGAEVTAAPRPPVTSAPASPPPAYAPPPPAPAPVASAPAPVQVASATPPSMPTSSSTPGAPRELGQLIVGPGGEIRGALPGSGSALPNTAPSASDSMASSYFGPMPAAVVLFNDGATQLSAEQRQGLSQVVRAVTSGSVRIVGHASPAKNTNSSAAMVSNLNASWDRAEAVASALISLGMPASRIKVEADTTAVPAPAMANVPSGDAGMRRADIFLQ